jgi:hypothetical protein
MSSEYEKKPTQNSKGEAAAIRLDGQRAKQADAAFKAAMKSAPESRPTRTVVDKRPRRAGGPWA